MCTARRLQAGGIYTRDADTQPPHNPTNTIHLVMTCQILKRPADCTRLGPSTLVYTETEDNAVCWRAGDPWAPLNCKDSLFRLTSLRPRQTGGPIGRVLRHCRTTSIQHFVLVFLHTHRTSSAHVLVPWCSDHPLYPQEVIFPHRNP